MSKDTGGPAFPMMMPKIYDLNGPVPYGGMTLRDYFAARFMAAMALHTFEAARDEKESAEQASLVLAGISYKMADTMLAERAKE